MSIRVVHAKVEPSDDETLDDLLLRTQENLSTYAVRHRDFSAIIENHIDDNYLIIKSLMLEEAVN